MTHKVIMFEALQDINNFRGEEWEKGERKKIETENGKLPEIVQNLELEEFIKRVDEEEKDDFQVLMDE